MVATAELVFFAIQAGIRLAKVGRTIYVEETIRGDLGFPLPMTINSVPAEAKKFGLQLKVSGKTREKLIYKRDFERFISMANEQDTASLVAAYIKQIGEGRAIPKNQAARDLAGVMMLRQWDAQSDPLPSPLQRVAGTLVGIAIDYAIQVPGAISADSRYGKTIKSFLMALDEVQVDQAIAHERWDSVVITLFTAGLDAVKDHPELFSLDDDASNITKAAMNGVAEDLAKRLKNLDGPDVFVAEDRLKRFGAVVLRSVLTGTSRSMIENPEVLRIKDKAEQALVSGVGTAFLDLLLGNEDVPLSLSAGLRRIATTDGLDRLVKAAMQAVAAHPDLIKTGKTHIDTWLRNLLVDLYKLYPEGNSLFDPELIANVAYLTLHHGINDLNGLLLRNVNSSQRALAVEVAAQVLGVLVTQPNGNRAAKWRYDLSRKDIEHVVSGSLAALANHPEWLFEKPRNRKLAAATLPLVLELTTLLGMGSDGAWFKSLIRNDRLEDVLAAIIVSGAFQSLADDDGSYPAAKPIAKAVTTALEAVRREGIEGVGDLLTYELMHDFMLAMVKSGVLDKLVQNTDAVAVRTRLVALVARLRKREVLTISEMTDELTAA